MIPKVVYQTWYEKNLPEKFEKIRNHNKQLNPEYNFILYDNNDLNNLFYNIDNKLIKSAYLRLNPLYGSARSDFFRYLIIYLNGGIYLDIKIICKKSFKDWIDIKSNGYISYWKSEKYNKDILKNEKGELQNWFIIYQKRDKNLFNLLLAISYNILNAPYENNYGKFPVLMYTGPIIYSQYFLKNINQYKLIDSSEYLTYTTNDIKENNYIHYSLLKNSLFLLQKDVIPKIIYINYKKLIEGGLYILKKYENYLPLYYLINNCDLFIVIKNNELYMIGFHQEIKKKLSIIIKNVIKENKFQIKYYENLCIKQGFIDDNNYLIYDNNKYCKFNI
jgi:mannosyltransferase OCH1-like enzyme